jgi:hypothetical protein
MRSKLRNQFLFSHKVQITPFSESALTALLTTLNPSVRMVFA